MTTSGRPTADQIRSAVELATHAPSVHNTQPWRWRVTTDALELFADGARRLQHTDPNGRLLMISCGAALHHLTVAMGCEGWASRVVRLPDPHQPDQLASVTFERSEPGDQLREWGQAIMIRRTDRRSWSSWAVPDAYVERLVELAAEHGVVAQPMSENELAAWSTLADTAQKRRVMAAYREELYDWMHRPESTRDGIPAANRASVDQPDTTSATPFPPGDLPLAAPTDATAEPVSLMLATTSDDVLSRLRAGEALSAVLLEATRLGLSTSIDSQALEVAATRDAVEDDLLGGLRTPQILVTVGWSAASGRVPATPRREVADILTTTTLQA